TWAATTSGLTAGNHSVSASYVHTGAFQDSSGSLASGQNVNPKSLTASIIGNPTKTYDGTTSATLAPANFSLTGLVGSDNFTVTQTAGIYNSKDVAAAATVTATLSTGQFTPSPGTTSSNYSFPTSASGAGSISKANATVTVTPYNVAYDGASHTATVASIVGFNGETGATVGSVNLAGTTHVMANT